MMAHIISFLLAAALSIQLYLLPQTIVSIEVQVAMLIGIMIGFYHGVGFEPANPVRKFLFGPPICWPLMLWGLYYAATNMGFI